VEFDERLLRVLILVDVTEWLNRLGWMRECEYRQFEFQSKRVPRRAFWFLQL